MTNDLSPSQPTPSGTPLYRVWLAVSILATAAAPLLTVWGLRTTNELGQSRELNGMLLNQIRGLQQQLSELQQEQPVRERQLRGSLDALASDLSASRSLVRTLEDDKTSLERRLAEQVQAVATLQSAYGSSQQGLQDCQSVLKQDRPVVLSTVNLTRGQRYTNRSGLVIEFTGLVNDMVTFLVDGSRRFGVPIQTATHLQPLRFYQEYGAFVGVQMLSVFDKGNKVEMNIVQFPKNWSFAVR